MLLVACLAFSVKAEAEEGGEHGRTPVRVELALHVADTGTETSEPVPATIEARWYGREAKAGLFDTVTSQMVTGRSAEIALPAGPWVLRAHADDYWGNEVHLIVTEDATEVVLGLWPEGTIAGRLSLPPGSSAPGTVWVFTHPSPEQSPEGAPPPAKLRCPVEDRSWSCQIPAGRLDLRFQADGYVPVFHWNAAVPAGETLELGTMPLVPGASVYGWVETVDRRDLGGRGSIRLTPDAACLAERPDEGRRIANRSLTTSIDERGFFDFGTVPPGSYVIEARAEPYAPASGPVQVVAGQPTQIANPPLVLDYPETLEVLLDPPVDPDGQPWRVALFRVIESGAGPAQIGGAVAAGPAEVGGWWEHRGLERGHYRLEVLSGKRPWYRRAVEVDDDPPPVLVDLHGVPAEGKVTLGGEPLPATLTFEGPEGVTTSEARSDADGEFSILFPHPGLWTAVVSTEDPKLHRTVPRIEVAPDAPDEPAFVRIELFDATLSGRVTTENGDPARDALVQARSLTTGVVETARTGKEGRFELRGLDEGHYDLRARGRGGLESGTLTVRVGGEPPDEERTLVLRQRIKIAGSVLSDAGTIPGATVTVEPIDRASLGTPILVTNARGRFEAPLPAGTGHIQITVGAPGFALRMLRMPLPEDAQVPIRVDQAAGTLVLDLGEAVSWLDPETPAFTVVHGQASKPLPSLLRWAAQNGAAPETPAREVEIPWMEPGHYALCWSSPGARRDQVSNIEPGCVEGYLSISGRLELARPAVRD